MDRNIFFTNKEKRVATVTAVVFTSIVFTGIFGIFKSDTKFLKHQTASPITSEAKVEVPEKEFPNTTLEARAAVVWDVQNKKVLFEKNSNEPLPLASLTKVMSAIVASAIVPDSTIISIDANSLREEGDTGLYLDEKWKLRDLLDFSLLTSSNDGMRAIASTAGASYSSTTQQEGWGVFIKAMNEKAKELGLSNTEFYNESGLDVNTEVSGGYGSALDTALLFDHIIRTDPSIIEATKYATLPLTSLDGLNHTAQNTNKVAFDIPGLIASKTGYTILAGGNLVIVFNPGLNRPIVISVLGSSFEGRFTDTLALVEATMNYLRDDDPETQTVAENKQ